MIWKACQTRLARKPSHLQRSAKRCGQQGLVPCTCIKPHAALLPAAQRWQAHPGRAALQTGLGNSRLSIPSEGCGAEPPLPLEIRQMGSFDVTYRTRLEVNSGELPVLPLSIYGAVAMAHGPESLDGEMSSNAFFLHKFVRSSSGLAGLSFDEGNFTVFGYVTEVRPAWGSACCQGWGAGHAEGRRPALHGAQSVSCRCLSSLFHPRPLSSRTGY